MTQPRQAHADSTLSGAWPDFFLQVEDLAVERGGRPVFEGLSFSLAAGEMLLLTGPNGVGKSTLIRALLALLAPRQGRITLSIARMEDEGVATKCHYIGHRDALKPSLSVLENLRFWRAFLKGQRGMDLPDALETVGLGGLGDLPAAYLSAGQRRRLSLARLLVVERPIWVLDEPTSALDRSGEARLNHLMVAHRARKGAIIAATHLALGVDNARELRLQPLPEPA